MVKKTACQGWVKSRGVEYMYTIYYSKTDAPNETRSFVVTAPNKAIAHRIAERWFSDITILGIIELAPSEDAPRYPSARFINGQFRPVLYQDEPI